MIGGLLGVARRWSDGLVGAVLGFGAAALLASISSELLPDGFEVGGAVAFS